MSRPLFISNGARIEILHTKRISGNSENSNRRGHHHKANDAIDHVLLPFASRILIGSVAHILEDTPEEYEHSDNEHQGDEWVDDYHLYLVDDCVCIVV